MKIKLLAVLIIFTFTSCVMEKIERSWLVIENKTHDNIYTICSQTDTINEYSYDFYCDSIQADSTRGLNFIRPLWKDLIEESQGGKLSLFIIPQDSVEKYGWDSIFSKQIYSKKYRIDMDYLKKYKWTIVYPTQK